MSKANARTSDLSPRPKWTLQDYLNAAVGLPYSLPPMSDAAAAFAGVRYKRSRFTTRLPAERRYTAAHMWLAHEGGNVWRVGYTKFAVRMLGEVVESGFEVKADAPIAVGEVIGWLEGFKASTDVYCAIDGTFMTGNPLLNTQADRVHADPYGDGWLYRATGQIDADSMDVHGYMAVLDAAIDRIQGEQHDAYQEEET